MNFLTEMKLGPRLAGAFAIVVALFVGNVVFALVRMQSQNADMDRVVRSEVGTLLALMQLETQTQSVSVSLRDSILSDKGDVVKAALANVDKTVAEIASTTEQAQQLASDAEKKHLQAVVATQAGFVAAVKKVSATMHSGDNDAAREQLVSDGVRSARKAYVEALSAAVTAQRAETEHAREAGSAAFGTSLAIILALAALASTAAAVVATLLTRSVVRPAGEAISAARRIAGGNLTAEIAAGGHDEMGEILGAMRTMQDSLRRIVGQVRVSADNIQVASGEVAAGNGDLSVRTEQTASSLQQTASSMEQLTGTVTQSSDAARQASQLASSAADVAQRGGSVVSQVVATMEDINTSSRRINDIIGVIDGIAFQTNILALNAAVEAARAGEQGRGFAVVASEVRSLAQRSAEAAREIKALIGASVDKVESGSKLVADAGSTMGEIVASVQRVADIIGEITAAAGEQREGIGEINGAIGTLDRMTQQNAALVEQSAAAAESLKDQALRLSQAVGAFRIA